MNFNCPATNEICHYQGVLKVITDYYREKNAELSIQIRY